ncbi:MAG TPA: hypothetical protein VIX91_08230 [Candidatus Acidoferrum sp.]
MKNRKLYLLIERVVPVLALLWVISAGCLSATAQTSSSTAELEKLKLIVGQQQKALEQQQAQILALQSALAEQKKMLVSVMGRTSDGTLVPAVDRKTDNDLQAQNEPPPVPSEQQALTPEQTQVEEDLQRGPEIADVTPTTPALRLGPAKIRLIGYPALTTLWRSSNNGGNVATNFNNIPYDNTVLGTTSEFRLSPQSTRLALRVDADLKTSQVAGYFEMDFVGAPVGGNLVTQSGYPFRIRQAWLDWRKGKWEMTGGQLWSLMTPNKEDILPWPGDIAAPQVIDLNFVAGFVVGRYPQFRLIYRPSEKMAFGFSVENPEQQVSNSVVFPSALNNTLTTQYNTGGSGLNVPNMTPDFVLKGSFDDKIAGGRGIHFDIGTVMRTFRSWDGSRASGKDYAFGWGVEANFNMEFKKGVRWVWNGFASDGAGRYIGGLAPDVIVRADGSISPIHSYSWVSGFELAPNKATGLYFYYSGLYAQKNATLNSDGTCCVGFGFPGASNVADRLIEEATGGYSRVLWKYENLGSVQWGLQYAHVWVYPWAAGNGPRSANANMVFSQLRYNLP